MAGLKRKKNTMVGIHLLFASTQRARRSAFVPHRVHSELAELPHRVHSELAELPPRRRVRAQEVPDGLSVEERFDEARRRRGKRLGKLHLVGGGRDGGGLSREVGPTHAQ